MKSYSYKMQDASGQQRSGVIRGASLEDAAQLVRRHGELLEIAPFVGGLAGALEWLRSISFSRAPRLKDVYTFTSQLAVMIKAGINIRDALGGIAEQADCPKFKRILQRIKMDVESGRPFSEALARHPKLFSKLYISMVRAAELSGKLAHMLRRITDHLTQQLETRRMIRGAMAYPVIICLLAVGTMVFCLAFVLPRFTALFAKKEAVLPAPTLALMAMSEFLRSYWYGVVVALVGLGWGLHFAIGTAWGRLRWDRLKLRAPLVSGIFRALHVTRCTRTMGELLAAGAPMLDSLSITAEVAGNKCYQRLWESVYADVKRGRKIARSLARQSLIPPPVVQMISAGEESGTLAEVMHDIAEYYAAELRSRIKAATAMIEPMMIVAMGLMVGFIAMSIILPIFKLSGTVQ